MATALAEDDWVSYLGVLADVPLFMPGFASNEDGQPPRIVTEQIDNQTFVPVFTSPEALYEYAKDVAESFFVVSCAELAATWPDEGWRLAVNPRLPIGVHLGIDDLILAVQESTSRRAAGAPDQPVAAGGTIMVADDAVRDATADGVDEEDLTATAGALVDFQPANATELALHRALDAADEQGIVDALMGAEVLMPTAVALARPTRLDSPIFPWCPIEVQETRFMVVFTSAHRYAEGMSDLNAPTVSVALADLLHAWPDRSCGLAINPGSTIELVLADQERDALIDLVTALPSAAAGSAGDATEPLDATFDAALD
jgi:hypothetical protein